MAQQIDWAAKAAYAQGLDDASLGFAYTDAVSASLTLPEQAIGKDASYYRDEASIYMREISARKAQPVCHVCGSAK